MKLSQVLQTNSPGSYVAGILWLGLGTAFIAGTNQLVFEKTASLPTAIGLLTLFVAAIVATFSLRYMRADERPTRFFVTLGTLAVAVLTFLFTNNLILLAAAWCASSWLLTELIGHNIAWREGKNAAKRARLTFIIGDGALLAALGLLGWHTGSWQTDAVLAGSSSLPPLLATLVALLLVIGAGARCALPPFSGWLLSSMTAPTPVSAMMHAGFVNAGGFLLIHFAPVLEMAPFARLGAVALGLCGAIYGIGIMLVRPDVKRALAGSTISQMGFMIMSCGLGAYAAALWHIIAHGLFKAWLFLGSGSTIGMRSAKPMAVSGATALVIAVGTVSAAFTILTLGKAEASLLPLLLGLATAAATFMAALGSEVRAGAKGKLLLTLITLLTCHGAGLSLARMTVGADGTPLVPAWALLLLLTIFLGLWVWQQQRLSTGRGLPLPIYVHLINAGSLPAAAKGDK